VTRLAPEDFEPARVDSNTWQRMPAGARIFNDDLEFLE